MTSLQLISCNDCTEYKLVIHNAIFLVTCLVTLEKKVLASCRSHVTRCNLGLQFAMVSKQSIQSLQKVEPSSTLCSHCKPTNVVRQVAKRACYMVQLVSQRHCNRQLAKKITPCNTSSTFCNYWRDFLTIRSCSSRLERVFLFQHCKLQPKIAT